MTRGVIIGKFYPLHKGHQYLIESALKKVDELTIIVGYRKDEIIPGKLRAKWIKDLYPSAKVMLILDHYDQNDSKLWAKKTIEWLGYVPDYAFTSENYGKLWTKYMGSKHVLVDLKRNKFPISGTAARKNPLKSWGYLSDGAKAFFAKRICLVGAESSGTTTLAMGLAKHYKTSWVPEFGRIFAEGRVNSKSGKSWKTSDFEFIAKSQNILEDELVKVCNKILICDTDSFATSIWHERYMGFKSKNLETFTTGRKYDLYLVTDCDIPFVPDSTRDGKHIRSWMHKRFVEELKRRNKNFIVLSGSRKKRLSDAIGAIDAAISL